MAIASLPRPPRKANEKLKELVRQGYFRRWNEGNGALDRMTPSTRWAKTIDPLLMVIGRFRPSEGQRSRLLESVEEAFRLTGGRLQVIAAEEQLFFGRSPTCEDCGLRFERPTPALFSFHSPMGACAACQGFGRVQGIDRERVIPDPRRSLEEGAIAPWNSEKRIRLKSRMLEACRAAGVRTDVPWQELKPREKSYVWSGKGFTNLDQFFARLERKSYRMHIRMLLARYRSYETCPECDGKRLLPEALAVKIDGRNVVELLEMSVEQLLTWIGGLDPGQLSEGSEPILHELGKRLEVLHRVGLDYLSFVRQARTLSGGESQRIHLASALASGLTGTLYVLDEPTIGLHPGDTEKLISLLEDLADKGNTVLVVEHDRKVIEGADHVIDLGPGAGEHGGRIVAQGTLAEILESDSLTSRYLRLDSSVLVEQIISNAKDFSAESCVCIRGARENNLRNIDVPFPLGCLVAVTGVSGSGKSTLIENVLYGTYQRSRGVVDVEPGACDGLEGLEALEDIILVDQRPLARSSRSNPATYTKAYDEIRKLYAATDLAKQRGIDAGSFSFNLDKGRCPGCQGTGSQLIDLHFMEPVRVICEDCNGRRFRRDILEIRLEGRSIDATLDLTVQETVEVFAGERRLCRRLQSLLDVGLGYLRLGQTTATLSGGEAQRLKLARFLDRRPGSPRHLFLFDEPTTGLHMADIDRLYDTLRRLVKMGDSVVVIEHSPDLVARADWIIDLGPGGGDRGGDLLFSGPLAGFLETCDSPTAQVLRQHLPSFRLPERA